MGKTKAELLQEIASLRHRLGEVGEFDVERHRAEVALGASQRQTRAILDHTTHFIGLLGPDGTLLDANEAALGLGGLDEADVKGKLFWECPWWAHSPEQQAELRDGVGRAATGEFVRFEAHHSTPDGETRYVDGSLKPVKDETGGILAGGIAHDFNNLLMGIAGNAELALQSQPPRSPARDCLNELVQATQRAAALTSQMLAYSGKGQFVLEAIDLPRLVADMNELLRSTVTKKTTLDLRLPSNLPAIRGDASQIRQIVMNLVINAAEAIGEAPGRITVTANEGVGPRDRPCRNQVPGTDEWPPGPQVVLEVTDTGCGMDEATKAKLFEPFFTTKFTGRGLGMAAVHGILRGHRAAVEVESEPHV
ncbi:MAG: PAS domain-containing protein, partial [Deltaproteobacteria bacterium]|nr:PAS domain-containing protein [Deltaproteobacteria bacterium]